MLNIISILFINYYHNNIVHMRNMWLTLVKYVVDRSGKASGRKKTLLQYSSLTPLERECYEEEVQPYRKTDYKPMMMMNSIVNTCALLFIYYHNNIIHTCTSWRPTYQRLPPARGGTAQRKIFRSQLIHPGPSSSRSSFFI